MHYFVGIGEQFDAYYICDCCYSFIQASDDFWGDDGIDPGRIWEYDDYQAFRQDWKMTNGTI